MKKIQLIMFFVAFICLLTGCSMDAKKYDKNTLVVKRNGSIVEIAVEDFKDSSIQAGDLEAYIDEQIEDYNGENGKLVKKSYIDTEDMSKVKLVLNYKDMESFNGFNLLECTLDAYENVKEEDLEGDFTSADGKNISYTKLSGTEKADVLILSEATDVVVKGDILYYNDQVSVKDGVVTTSGEGKAIIIFK
ncbi:MAG: hypothetical protein K2L07_08155 [Lachnospiraceae bacterium]|nr:hypothetical protein [Lachnospiraceae bacterium]